MHCLCMVFGHWTGEESVWATESSTTHTASCVLQSAQDAEPNAEGALGSQAEPPQAPYVSL